MTSSPWIGDKMLPAATQFLRNTLSHYKGFHHEPISTSWNIIRFFWLLLMFSILTPLIFSFNCRINLVEPEPQLGTCVERFIDSDQAPSDTSQESLASWTGYPQKKTCEVSGKNARIRVAQIHSSGRSTQCPWDPVIFSDDWDVQSPPQHSL